MCFKCTDVPDLAIYALIAMFNFMKCIRLFHDENNSKTDKCLTVLNKNIKYTVPTTYSEVILAKKRSTCDIEFRQS